MTQKANGERRKKSRASFRGSRFVMMKQGGLSKDYDVGEKIGTGAYGEIYKCVHKESQTSRAVKVVQKSSSKKENEDVMKEFKIIKELDHPNLLKVYELFEDETYFYIVTDIYSGGSLFDYIIETAVWMKRMPLILWFICCQPFCTVTRATSFTEI